MKFIKNSLAESKSNESIKRRKVLMSYSQK